ncbi:MAG: septation protein A [Tepidiphilus sp.]|jgi:intracellular septation protein|nr:septation protein A [Tepidiphilus sp.]MDD3433129.1 septation protein A [Tepidiphilus sp.]
MKLLFDLLPILVFFLAYRVAGLFPEAVAPLGTVLAAPPSTLPLVTATAATMLATVAQILALRLRGRPVDRMLWVSFVLVTVLGGATLFLHDPAFIQWKPTALYWSFAAALIGARLLRRNLIRSAMQAQLRLPDPVWAHLSDLWSGFFLVLGALNLYVAWNYSEAAWVNFKLFGTLGATVLFVLAQSLWLSRHLQEEKSDA